MFENKNIGMIIAVIVAIILIYCLFFRSNETTITRTTTIEDFAGLSQYPSNLADHYVPQSAQLQGSASAMTGDLSRSGSAIDTLPCHPACCGDQWPVPFDGLTADQIQKSLTVQGSTGPYVRTSYTCANGPGGVGCPCVPKNSYAQLVNRGQDANCINGIEPTLLINRNVPRSVNINLGLQSQDNQQIYTDGRLLNDLRMQRPQYAMSNVQAIEPVAK